MKPVVRKLAEKLNLQPHPEGGYFREVYRSDEQISADALPCRYEGDRSICTSIYYLITSDAGSAMHRLKSDEVLHFYMGDPARVFMLLPDGTRRDQLLGNDIYGGERPQIVVPRNIWFGIRVVEGGDYTLTGTTVAPGFDFEDFELDDRKSSVNPVS